MMRQATKDTVLEVPTALGSSETRGIPIPKGTVVSSSLSILNVAPFVRLNGALCYCPNIQVGVDQVGIRECPLCSPPCSGDVLKPEPRIEYNERYFEDPYAFKPSRWYAQETTEGVADAFTAFSIGTSANSTFLSDVDLNFPSRFPPAS